MSGSYNIRPSERTEIIRGSENVIDAVLRFASNTKTKFDACLDYTRPALVVAIGKSFADIKGKGIRIRVLTEITADNISYCKQLSTLVDDLRHLDGIKGSFYISEAEYLAPALFHEEGKAASQLIYTNVNEIVEHQQYLFDTLWDKAIQSQEKIKEIEYGIQPHFIETIRDPYQLQKLAVNLGRSAREEILLLYSTANAFHRQCKLGSMDLLKKTAIQHRLKIRLLTPSDDSIKQQARELGKYVDIRYIPEEIQTQITIFVIDRKSSLVVEIEDDSKNSSYEAMGLGTYSKRNSIVLCVNI
jgi:two-component system, OmpR family, sensor histidine kinase VicK